MPSPLHPFVVHFPIALLPLSIAADRWLRQTAPEAGWRLWQLGTAGALLASGVGLYDHFPHRLGPFAHEVEVHQLWGLGASVFALAWAMWRGYQRHVIQFDPGTTKIGILISLSICAMLASAAYTGGVLVYDHAIGVHTQET